MLTKEKFYEIVNEKVTITKDEFEKIYNEKYNEVVSKGIEKSKRELYTVSMLRAYFKRQFSSPALKFIGYCARDMGVTDYGAQKMYNDSMKLYDENPESAIKQGVVNDSGVPVYTRPDWKKGQVIDVEQAKVRTLMLYSKSNGDEDYKVTFMNLRGKNLTKDVPLFKQIEFRANKSEKSDKTTYYLNDSVTTEFKIINDKEIDAVKFVGKYMADKCCELKDLKDYHDKNATDYNRFVCVKGTVARVNITADHISSNIIELDSEDLDLNLDEPNLVTCWVPKSITIDFSELTPNVLIIGRTDVNKDGKLTINAQGVWCEDVWKETPDPVVENAIKTEEPEVVKEKEPESEPKKVEEDEW